MLVLTRKSQQKVTLELPNGDEITILVARIEGNKVRLGIQAPKKVKILREELVGSGQGQKAS